MATDTTQAKRLHDQPYTPHYLERYEVVGFEQVTANILGSRTNHPSTGATSDLRVEFSDGRPAAEGFAYYADAYAHARLTCAPANITRNGRKARAAR